MTDLVEVGYVARAHALRGELRVVCHNRDSDLLTRVDALVVGGQRYSVTRVRPVDRAFLVVLAGVSDRNRADALKGKTVEIDRDAMELHHDDVLLADLVGCRVVLSDGSAWGEIVAIEIGPQDRLVIRDGGIERLLPVVDEFVLGIDVDAGIVTVAPPEGLPEAPVK